jgi:hypothetical protein
MDLRPLQEMYRELKRKDGQLPIKKKAFTLTLETVSHRTRHFFITIKFYLTCFVYRTLPYLLCTYVFVPLPSEKYF